MLWKLHSKLDVASDQDCWTLQSISDNTFMSRFCLWVKKLRNYNCVLKKAKKKNLGNIVVCATFYCYPNGLWLGLLNALTLLKEKRNSVFLYCLWVEKTRNYDCMLRDAKRKFCHLCDCCFWFNKDKSPMSPFGMSARFVETLECFHFILPTSLGARCRLPFGCGHSRLSRFKTSPDWEGGLSSARSKTIRAPPQIYFYLSVLATVFSHQARLWPSTEVASPPGRQVSRMVLLGSVECEATSVSAKTTNKPRTQMGDASNDDESSTNSRYSATPHEPFESCQRFCRLASRKIHQFAAP